MLYRLTSALKIYLLTYLLNSSTTLCCLPSTGPYYRSSYTCSNPQVGKLATRCPYQPLGFNHASPQPSHHSPLSVDPSLLPSRSLVGSLPRSSSTLHHINTTYTHLNKLPPEYPTSTARSRNSPTHLPLLTATLLLCGEIQPNPGLTHPANLLICTLKTRSMLSPEHVTALNDLTDNHKPDTTETWIRSSTTHA